MGHKTEPSFTALANELIANIAGYARFRDVLSLRQTSRTMADNCGRVIKEQKFTLYLHPRRVQDAIKTCHVEIFRNNINEVALLGKSTQTLKPDDFSEGFKNFHPWPLSEDMQGLARFHLDDPSAYSKKHHWRKWIPTCYTDRWHHFVADGIRNVKLPHDHDFFRFWTDSELLMGILAAKCAPFTTISLHQVMPDTPTVRWTRLHDRWSAKPSQMVENARLHDNYTFSEVQLELDHLKDEDYKEVTTEIGHNVASLSVAMPDVDYEMCGDDGVGGLFHELAARLPNIEDLSVTINSDIDRYNEMLESGSHDNARHERFDAVQRVTFNTFSLHFYSKDCPFHRLRRLRWSSPTELPICHISSQARDFLEAYSTTLRQVSFSNIFFAESEGADGSGIQNGMREVIRAICDIPGLELGSLYVPRIEKSRLFEEQEPQWVDYSTRCYHYVDNRNRGGWFSVNVFDTLAEELRVPLEGAGWDFAKHLARQKGIDSSKED